MSPLNRAARVLFKAPVPFYDLGLGALVGHRFCLLTHRGRRSGLVYRTMLEVLDRDPETRGIHVIAGLGRGSQWLQNLEAGGALEVRCGSDRFVPAYRVLATGEGAQVLAGYERDHRLAARVIAPVLGRLTGISYDGTDESRHRVVDQLPVIELRPRRATELSHPAPTPPPAG
ncbi:MAG TPA: nitroreductase family deazaflavin-dependent oxidoreductase [Segeticoccus sp.]|nr:nitroreductase family deazaflavin-dependent oxidoreductase [Segeticoccus sp.]